MKISASMLAILLGCSAHYCLAADEESGVEANGFRSPAEMTVEERAEIMKNVAGYDTCVYQDSMAHINDFNDIRQIADAAMGRCQPKLDELGKTINDYKFDPGFAEQFLNSTRNRTVHKLIPELALRKAG